MRVAIAIRVHYSNSVPVFVFQNSVIILFKTRAMSDKTIKKKALNIAESS